MNLDAQTQLKGLASGKGNPFTKKLHGTLTEALAGLGPLVGHSPTEQRVARFCSRMPGLWVQSQLGRECV